jgi:hypothetical protein
MTAQRVIPTNDLTRWTLCFIRINPLALAKPGVHLWLKLLGLRG